MKEIIVKTETKAYRWKPTRWQKALWYGMEMTIALVGIYCWILLLYGCERV